MFMRDSPQAVQHEARLFIRGCQHALSTLSVPGCDRLSEDERRLIEGYARELLRALGIRLKN
jgi:hypothetical protein